MSTQSIPQAETLSAPLKTWTPADGVKVIPLALETRSHVNTAEAAHHLNLSPQTLRAHACFETGLIRPLRIPGVLALQWPVAAIKAALGLEVAR